MLSFECIKNEKSVYFLLTSAAGTSSPRLLPKHSPGTGCQKPSPREVNTCP